MLEFSSQPAGGAPGRLAPVRDALAAVHRAHHGQGLEDTALYVYNPLISLNEVGTDFLVVTPEDFHRFNQGRQENWPFALNATTTHDTKRSEDVRLRINVLSEIPREWEACLKRWSAWNAAKTAHGPRPGRTGCQRGIFSVPDPAGGLAAL